MQSQLTHKGRKIQETRLDWQTRARGSDDAEYAIYLNCANDGKGGDITRNGRPLLTYDEWCAR